MRGDQRGIIWYYPFMANERAQIPNQATMLSDMDARLIGDTLHTVFADRSAAAVAEHLAAGRPVAGVLHGVPVTIVPQTKPAGG